MKGYESVVVTTSEQSGEELEKTLNQIKEVVIRHGGELKKYHLWGKRRLAYQIQKKTHGIYHLLYLTGSGKMVDELSKHCRYSDSILRFHVQAVEDIHQESEFFLRLNQPKKEIALQS